MSEEEKKAIEYLKQNSIPILRYDNFGNILSPLYYGTFEKEIIVNLIEKQEKVIDEMTIYINKNIDVISKDIEGSICCHNKDGKCINRKCVECVKQYFYRKVENNEIN